MATDNLTWGAERIRGELLKLNIHLSKRTIQHYIRQARSTLPPSQSWKTFLDNHKDAIWVCDFLQVYDILFRPIFLFFILELGSRRVIHAGVTRSLTDAWVAQQVREATPGNTGPPFLIRDNDSKFGQGFRLMLASRGIEDLRLPCYSPDVNAVCERFQGSVRRECLDHIVVFNEQHLRRVIREYVAYYNQMRPHQGIGQSIPDPPPEPQPGGPVEAKPVLGGPHHHYYRKAA
jgi:transposase InsO family protein